MRPLIAPKDLAIAIGISESTIKRWANTGALYVSKTIGGHRRIAFAEAIRVIRATHASLVCPELLGLDELISSADETAALMPPEQRLVTYLYDGDARRVRGLIFSLYLEGWSIAQIGDGPIRWAMARLGTLWRHDPAGIFVEHRATDACIQAVQQIRQLVEPENPGMNADEAPENETDDAAAQTAYADEAESETEELAKAPAAAEARGAEPLVALGGAPPGDPYLLPSLLAASTLAEKGWQTVNLGADTPFESLLTAAERHKPHLVWLSISSIGNLVALREGIERLAHGLKAMRILLALGGQSHSLVEVVPGTPLCRGDSLAELEEIAQVVGDAQRMYDRGVGR